MIRGVEPRIQLHSIGQCNLVNMAATGFGATIIVGALRQAASSGVVAIPSAGRDVLGCSPRSTANDGKSRRIELAARLLGEALSRSGPRDILGSTQREATEMSSFDPLGSRVPLHLRPDGKSDGEHLMIAISAILRTVRSRTVPFLRRVLERLSRATISRFR